MHRCEYQSGVWLVQRSDGWWSVGRKSIGGVDGVASCVKLWCMGTVELE